MTRREYILLNDMPIAVVDGVNTASPTVYYVHTDHLMRPARMVAQNWAWVWDVIYAPFGGTAAIFDATLRLDMCFTGQWFQLESGLAYNWRRHYDATLGRYVQPDPIGYDGGRSLYGYVGQNPLAKQDPTGVATYSVNRDIGGAGLAAGAGRTCSRPANDMLTHTFIFSTNPDGAISHTYSWGNTENTHGWNLDRPLDIRAAAEAMARGHADFIGPDWIDQYFMDAFNELNKPENNHSNWGAYQ